MKTVADYLARITSFHRPRPKFVATVDLSVSPFVAVASGLDDLPRAFDLDEAVGVQLDADGEWIGYTRFLTYPLPHRWFSLGDPHRGLNQGIWLQPGEPETGVTRLDDAIYRALLKAKVRLNAWDGSGPGAVTVYDTFFADTDTRVFVQDNQDETMVVGIAGEIPQVEKLMLLAAGYLPARPVGVTAPILVTSANGAPVFGLGVDNDHIGGLGHGAFGVAPAYLVDHAVG